MICYRDMTFCSFYKDCNIVDCPRALTDEILRSAEVYRLSVCQFTDKPDCFVGEGEK